MSLLKNIFCNTKFIKYNILEFNFIKQIYLQKLKEINIFKKIAIINGLTMFYNWFIPKFSFVILILGFKFFDLEINKLFPLLKIISIIESFFIYSPYLIKLIFEMKVTLNRIQNFINLKEENVNLMIKNNSNLNNSWKINGSFFWNKKLSNNVNNYFKLDNLDINIVKNSLTFIFGKTSSGKTSLFYTILGDLEKQDDQSKIFINGKISFTPQNNFLQSKTIKNNILFYDDLDVNKLNIILENCDLKNDFNNLEKGIETEIGDDGVNLSGGQKARISLARSLYKNSDILLLDDPFGSLDIYTSTNIMENTILSKLKGKTRIIITSSTQFLKYADYIIYLDNGLIKFNGSKEDFLKKNYIENINSNEPNIFNEQDNYIHNEIIDKYILDEDKVKNRNLKKNLFLFLKRLGIIYLIILFILTLTFVICIFKLASYISEYTEKESVITNNFIIFISIISVLPTILCGFIGYFIAYLIVIMVRNLHSEMIFRILHAKINKFLDRTPVGRLLNRFTKDIHMIERLLPNYFIDIFFKITFTIMNYFAIIYTTNILSIFLVVIFIIYAFYTQNSYIKISKDATRLDAITKTPILNLTTEIAKGLYMFKNFGKKKEVKKEFKNLLNENIKNALLIEGLTNWFKTRISLSNIFIIQVFTFIIIIYLNTITKENFYMIPVAIFFIISWVETMIQFINTFSTLENNLISIERCYNFTQVPVEENYINYNKKEKWFWENIKKITLKNTNNNFFNENIDKLKNNNKLFNKGNIYFENISANYPSKINNVLNNITLEIKGNEKIGIIGRTGSGKSSLIKLLTRSLKNNMGNIIIDGYNIENLDLKILRNEIFIISQEISLFKGTIFENIDLNFWNEKYIGEDKNKIDNLNKNLLENQENLKKEKILEILIKMGFNKDKLKNGLDYKIEENGKNLSQGEKQIISFIRVIFTKSKIIILDEATSNVDIKTENLMLNILEPYIKNKTVLIITHKLNTLWNCDKILTLKNGSIDDFRPKDDLIEDKNSYFYKMLYLNK